MRVAHGLKCTLEAKRHDPIALGFQWRLAGLHWLVCGAVHGCSNAPGRRLARVIGPRRLRSGAEYVQQYVISLSRPSADPGGRSYQVQLTLLLPQGRSGRLPRKRS